MDSLKAVIPKGCDVEEVCPLCGSTSFVLETLPTIHPTSKMAVELRECASCAHWFHNPLPTQELLTRWYNEGNEYVVPKKYGITEKKTTPGHLNYSKRCFEECAQHQKKINKVSREYAYLELGIGSGELFSFFKQYAKHAYGIEPGAWGKNLGETIVNDITDLPNKISFDIVVAHDVLEHVRSPLHLVKQLHSVTAPKGIIHVTFPNKDSYKARIQKSRWHMVRPFGHLHYFSKKSIEKLFPQKDWELLVVKSARLSDKDFFQVLQDFDYSEFRVAYTLIKSLLLGQLILGKDQWKVIAIRK